MANSCFCIVYSYMFLPIQEFYIPQVVFQTGLSSVFADNRRTAPPSGFRLSDYFFIRKNFAKNLPIIPAFSVSSGGVGTLLLMAVGGSPKTLSSLACLYSSAPGNSVSGSLTSCFSSCVSSVFAAASCDSAATTSAASSFSAGFSAACAAALAVAFMWLSQPAASPYLPDPAEFDRMNFTFYRELALPGQDLGISEAELSARSLPS